MKKYTFLPFIVTIIILSLTSCKKDFLDNVNGNYRLIAQDYVIDLKTTNEYLTGVYASVGQILADNGTLIYPEIIADNIRPVPSGSGAISFNNQYKWAQLADNTPAGPTMALGNPNANGLSTGCYLIIRNCNFSIQKAEEYKSQNPELAESILGQAYGMRALAHFFLLNYFAQQYNFTANGSHPGVAYLTSYDYKSINHRNTVNEVYESIIIDLKKSLSLPINEAKPNYFTKTAALALLSRVYLNTGNFESAKNFAREVIKSKPLMTVNYPGGLFTQSDTEAILYAPPAKFDGSTNHSTVFPSFRFRAASPTFVATSDIAALLNEDPADKRKIWVSQSAQGNWNIVKYPDNVVPGFAPTSLSYNQTLIRSSEMYLIAAESYASLNRTDSAQYFLDELRLRANPLATKTTASGSDLFTLIYKERRKELAFEGFRMFDLLRWKKGVIRQDAVTGSPKELPYPSDKAIAPIPGLDVKTLGFEQNKGY